MIFPDVYDVAVYLHIVQRLREQVLSLTLLAIGLLPCSQRPSHYLEGNKMELLCSLFGAIFVTARRNQFGSKTTLLAHSLATFENWQNPSRLQNP